MGSAFAMGCIGGGVWHSIKGFRDAPRGWSNRAYGSLRQVQSRSPVLGGNFAVWGLSFSSFDCLFSHARKKDDPLNAIMAGFCTGGVIAWRAGWRSALSHACVGGFLLAMIEGMGIFIQKTFQGSQQDPNMAGPISPYSKAGMKKKEPAYKLAPPPMLQEKWDAEDEEFDLGLTDDDMFVLDSAQESDGWWDAKEEEGL